MASPKKVFFEMILAADNLQITHPAIARAIEGEDPLPILDLTQRMVTAGAQAVDINCGPLPRNAARKMTFLVRTVQSATSLPILLDTNNPIALRAGLTASKNRTIINGFSLEPRKIESILPLAREFRAEIVGYLLKADGHVPRNGEERLETAAALYEVFLAAGLQNSQLIIDPIVTPMIWENGAQQNRDILMVIRSLPDLLGFAVKTIAGVSNLTAGPGPLAPKRLLECAYASMLAAAGLNIALLNIFHAETVRTARACRAITHPGIFAWGEIS